MSTAVCTPTSVEAHSHLKHLNTKRLPWPSIDPWYLKVNLQIYNHIKQCLVLAHRNSPWQGPWWNGHECKPAVAAFPQLLWCELPRKAKSFLS